MNRLSVVMNELEKSERLVEGALWLVSSVQVLQKSEKENIESLLREAREGLKATRVFGRACGVSAQFFDSSNPRLFTAAGRARIGSKA
jgi:hypothetical protein